MSDERVREPSAGEVAQADVRVGAAHRHQRVRGADGAHGDGVDGGAAEGEVVGGGEGVGVEGVEKAVGAARHEHAGVDGVPAQRVDGGAMAAVGGEGRGGQRRGGGGAGEGGGGRRGGLSGSVCVVEGDEAVRVGGQEVARLDGLECEGGDGGGVQGVEKVRGGEVVGRGGGREGDGEKGGPEDAQAAVVRGQEHGTGGLGDA